jgi:hypothetical protein
MLTRAGRLGQGDSDREARERILDRKTRAGRLGQSVSGRETRTRINGQVDSDRETLTGRLGEPGRETQKGRLEKV